MRRETEKSIAAEQEEARKKFDAFVSRREELEATKRRAEQEERETEFKV
jgi:hypothetical protein